MRYSEFNEYKKSLLGSMTVNPDGSTNNDNNVRFAVTYLDTENVERNDEIIAKTMAEAVYRVCWMLMALHMPNPSEVEAEPEKALERMKQVTSFSNFAFQSIEDDGKNQKVTVTLTIDNIPHSFSVKPSLPNEEGDGEMREPYKIIDGTIEDNIIALWLQADERSVICQVYYSPLSVKTPFNDKLNVMEYYGYLNQFQMQSSNYAGVGLGFASASPEDDYDEEKGKEIARTRALYNKTDDDLRYLKGCLNNLQANHMALDVAIRDFTKMIKKIQGRQYDMSTYLKDTRK